MSDFNQTGRLAESRLGIAPSIGIVALTSVLSLVNFSCCQETRSVSAAEEEEQFETPRLDQINKDVNRTLPQLPDAVTELPKWVGQNMPFDIEQYFAVPAANGATKYLDALFEFDEHMKMCFRPGGDTRAAAARSRSKWLFWFVEHTDYEELRDIFDLEELEELRDIVAEYDEGFRKLRDAQREEACTFEIAIPLALIPHADAARSVGRVVFLSVHRHLADGKLDAAIGDVEMLLRLARDLRPRGTILCQLVSLMLEQWCWEDLLPHIISQGGLTIEHCDRMLKLISPGESVVDPILEGEKYQQLIWRQLLYQLERNEYDVAARARALELKGTFIVPTMLMFELCELGGYGINPDVVLRFAEQVAGQDEEVKKSFDQLKKQEYVNNRMTARGNKMLATLMLTQALMNVAADDWRRESEILDRRYEQMRKAVNLAYPQRAEELAALARSWTRDDAWEQAKILRTFMPKIVHEERIRFMTLRRRLATCLIALVRGRLAGAAESADLATLVQAAGLPNVPLDPYSGTALRSTEIDGQPVIYSVGPDGDDDQALREAALFPVWPIGKPPDGDVSLRWTTSAKDED